MKNRKRQIGGLTAKREGDKFEVSFDWECRNFGITCIRVPDGCKTVAARRIIRVRSPFDYILGFCEKVAFVDLKSFDSDRITYSQIDRYQLHHLYEMSGHARAGYIVNLRKANVVVFYPAGTLMRLQKGSSLKKEDGIDAKNLQSIFYGYSIPIPTGLFTG